MPRRPCGMRNSEDQLEAEPLPLSKIPDRSTEGNGRPHRTTVFDFRFRARYEPQLVLKSMCSRRPDPVQIKLVHSGTALKRIGLHATTRASTSLT